MQNYEYFTEPFSGQTTEKDKQKGTTLAKQLNELINLYASQGWEFYRVDQLTIIVKNGCLATLFGNPFSSQIYDVVIFRRETSSTS